MPRNPPRAIRLLRRFLSLLSLGAFRPHLPPPAFRRLASRVALCHRGDRHTQPVVATRGARLRLWLRLDRTLRVREEQPASFKQPLYSLMGDWKMFWQIVAGRIAFLMVGAAL